MKLETPLWSGKVSLNNVLWTHKEEEPQIFSDEFNINCQKFWKRKSKEAPHLYDGNLVLLESFSFSGEKLNLKTKMIKFSKIFYCLQNEIALPKTLGSLGFQIFIWNQKKDHILAGRRSLSSEYMPGFWTVPGGMFESFDTRSSLKKAVMRELQEEIDLEINTENLNLIAILPEQHNLGAILVIETSISSRTMEDISGNEEWEYNLLKWVPLRDLYNYDPNQLMEGLLYLTQRNLY
ncbi:MAG: NUDIX hydrolase [Candidatus Hodarchaeales archaeon]